jgi:SAM-dependent methyltransferase
MPLAAASAKCHGSFVTADSSLGDPSARLAALRSEWDRHAEVYDEIYRGSEDRRLSEELAFLSWAFAELAARPVERVLDLTAGTGLQSAALAARGYRVTAADLSGEMLERCRARAARRGVELERIVRRAAHETDEPDEYDACISCFAGFSHMLDDREVRATLAAVHCALRPGGVLVFDVVNLLEDALSAPAGSVERSGETAAGGRFRTVLDNRYDTWRRTVSFSEETTVERTGAEPVTVRAGFTYRGFTREELLALLGELPWARVRAFRGYGDRGESGETRVYRLVFAALKA